MISAMDEEFHSVALPGVSGQIPMRNRRVERLAFVLSAVERCELFPDITIMPDFPNVP